MSIEAVILAAGFSSRAKTFKMELDFNGKTMLEKTLEAFLSICSKITVVGGYKVERIRDMIKTYDHVELVYNENFDKGMFSSVKKGITNVSSQRFFLSPGDCPLITENLLLQMLQYNDEIIIPSFQGRKGHPVLINSNLISEIITWEDTSNLKVFIDHKGYQLIEVNESGILYDVDTIEDYNKLRNKTGVI